MLPPDIGEWDQGALATAEIISKIKWDIILEIISEIISKSKHNLNTVQSKTQHNKNRLHKENVKSVD
jgi:hypothetical protein